MFPMKCYIFCSAATGPDQLLDSLLLLTSRQKNGTPPIKKRIGSRELAANPVTIKLCWFDELCWFPSIRIRLTNCVASPDHYPLVMTNIAIEHGHRNSEFSH